jgi:uncharacterized protein (DUF488 family)
VADVRRHPGSRRLPHFGSDELRRLLAEDGRDYLHLPELGGRRRPVPGSQNGGWRSEQFQGYADHMATTEFLTGVERLLQAAEARRTAIMCAEAQWWRCHRRLLSDALLARCVPVEHIDSRGGSEPHSQTDFALIEDGRLSYPPAQGRLEL